VSASAVQKPISPYIFGKNNSLLDEPNPQNPVNWQLLKDLGINMYRENGGNNATNITGGLNYPVIPIGLIMFMITIGIMLQKALAIIFPRLRESGRFS